MSNIIIKMKILVALTLAIVFTSVYAGIDLEGGDVLDTIKMRGAPMWGEWFMDLLTAFLAPFAMWWCSVEGFFYMFSGDSLYGWQRCWAGYIVTLYA